MNKRYTGALNEQALYRRIERAGTEQAALAVIKASDKLEDATGIQIGSDIRAAVVARIEELSQSRKQALAAEYKRLREEIRTGSRRN